MTSINLFRGTNNNISLGVTGRGGVTVSPEKEEYRGKMCRRRGVTIRTLDTYTIAGIVPMPRIIRYQYPPAGSDYGEVTVFGCGLHAI